MKKYYFLILVLFFTGIYSANSQSVLTLETGTSLGLFANTDFCANTITGQGIIYGSGTICGGLVTIEDPVTAAELPTMFELYQNYPNPFNPVTTIKYQLPHQSTVRLTVFDLLGRETAKLIDGEQPAGFYEVNFDASFLSSGVYLYKIEAGNFSKSLKMILIK